MSAFCSGLCNEISRCCYDFYHTPFTKKNLLIAGGVLVGLIILIIIIVVATTGSSKTMTANEILLLYPLVDGANSVSRNIKIHLQNNLSEFDANLSQDWKGCNSCQTDLARLKKGHVATQIFSVTSDCKAQSKDAVSQTLEQIDLLTRMAHDSKNNMSLILRPADILSSFNSHKMGVMINVWGGHNIDSRLAVLRSYYNLGVRIMSLVAGDPGSTTDICYPPWISEKGELTPFGKAVVKEMNRLGMIIDLTGTPSTAATTVLDITEAPVIFSHSASNSIFQNQFNVDKDALTKNKKMLVMVPFTPSQLQENGNASINDVIKHLNDIKKSNSHNVSVGIGSNFDNMTTVIPDLKDVSQFVNLINSLKNSKDKDLNWNDDDIVKLIASNFINTFNEIDIMGKRLQSNEQPDAQLIDKNELNNKTTCYTDMEVRYPGTSPTAPTTTVKPTSTSSTTSSTTKPPSSSTTSSTT